LPLFSEVIDMLVSIGLDGSSYVMSILFCKIIQAPSTFDRLTALTIVWKFKKIVRPIFRCKTNLASPFPSDVIVLTFCW